MPAPEVSEEWLAAILDTIDEGIHAVGSDGVTIFYNGAAGRLDGLNPEDVVGKHVLSVFPSLGQETSTLLQVLRSGRPLLNRPQTYTNFLGVKVHTVNTTLPIRVGGQLLGALEIAKDLTQIRNLADQVLALQAQMVGGRKGRRTRADAQSTGAVYQFSHLLTRDPQMLHLLDLAQHAARTTSPILVYGETGTGKELLVQAIHNASPRRQAPFLAVNCAALPGPLLESILFGTVRGSFTGAEDRPGMFELADEGTLFLDEIQSMSLELQAKLLRALQEGETLRVGDVRYRRIDVRVVAAMNQPPEAAVAANTLRQDLFYRINVVRLDLPPLRARAGDIQLLADHFVTKWNGRFRSRVTRLSPAAAAAFLSYPWPGNVRELENAVESAMNMVTVGEIDLSVLPTGLREWRRQHVLPDEAALAHDPPSRQRSAVGALARSSALAATAFAAEADPAQPPDWPEWAQSLEAAGLHRFWQKLADTPDSPGDWLALQSAFERMILARALREAGNNVTRAAAKLGLPRQTLQYRLQQLRL